jgi:hypothetical protein
MARSTKQEPVLIEQGPKRCFARSLNWPGWCRAGKTEVDAVEALLESAPRYGVVATAAGVVFPANPVVEIAAREQGSATTDFGAPGAWCAADEKPLVGAELITWLDLLDGAWTTLNAVAERSAEQLRKGPRGGGRDRTAVLSHVLEAERAYAAKLGVRWRVCEPHDAPAIAANRELICDALRNGSRRTGVGTTWPTRYWIHRAAWHVLDHAWEIEDKQT